MSDFIYSKNPNQDLKKRLKSIHTEEDYNIYEFSNEYATIAVIDNLYNGFNVYENENHICGVIGGPLLTYRLNDFIKTKKNNEGSKSIYERWIVKNEMKWDRDLSGPFVVFIFNKLDGAFKVVTDMLSFIPVYKNEISSDIIVGTHIDSIAVKDKNKIDNVSVADFIINETITFPYTIFNNITELNPATINIWDENSNYYTDTYWVPKENEADNPSIDELANKLIIALKDYLNLLTEVNANIAIFISGGADSRAVLGALPLNYKKDGFVFVDNANRESNISEKVSKIQNVKLFIKERTSTHYLDIMKPCVNLIGGGSDYTHVHTYGFHKTCNLNKYDSVIGGFLADTLLKCHHVKKRKIKPILRFLPIPEKKKSDIDILNINDKIKPNFLKEVNNRRSQRIQKIKLIRPNSANEWLNIWPISMHNDIPNIYGNRRLFRSFEPFTSVDIVKIAALATQDMKLNNRLFYKAMKPLYKKTKWVLHGSGYLPYFSWWINRPLQFLVKSLWTMQKKVNGSNKNEGSWSNWENLINSENGIEIGSENLHYLTKYCKEIFVQESINIRENDSFSVAQKRILLQLSYYLKNHNES